MKVISLFGKKNVGKTTTIRLAHDELIKRGYKPIPGKADDLKNGDFLDILEKDGQRVGIVSQGDYAIGENSVKKHLGKLKSSECYIAICACSTDKSKKIQDAVSAYCQDALILNKCPSEKDELQYFENMKDAKTLLKIIYTYFRKTIGYAYFKDCVSISEVYIGKRIRFIGKKSFCGCTGLTKLRIGPRVKKIKIKAFSGCCNLNNIVIEGFNVPKIYSTSFDDNTKADGTLYVQKCKLEEFRITPGWKDFKHITSIS